MTTKRKDNRIQTAADIWQYSPDELAFQHVLLCQLGFPRSKTEACQIELGRSMSDSLRQLRLTSTGATHWGRVMAQARAASAMNMKLGYETADCIAKTIDAKPIDEFEAWGSGATLLQSPLPVQKTQVVVSISRC